MPLRLVSVLVLVALSSCQSTAAPKPCAGNLQVVALHGSVATFTWLPRCTITNLAVLDEATAHDPIPQYYWSFSVPEQYAVGSSIEYGATPAKANAWLGPRTLTKGATYRVSVSYRTLGGAAVTASGEKTFTW